MLLLEIALTPRHIYLQPPHQFKPTGKNRSTTRIKQGKAGPLRDEKIRTLLIVRFSRGGRRKKGRKTSRSIRLGWVGSGVSSDEVYIYITLEFGALRIGKAAIVRIGLVLRYIVSWFPFSIFYICFILEYIYN